MMEIKGNIATITREPLRIDLADMADIIRQSIDDHLEDRYGFGTIENMECCDYQNLVNRALNLAKIRF